MVEHCPFKAGVLGSSPSRLKSVYSAVLRELPISKLLPNSVRAQGAAARARLLDRFERRGILEVVEKSLQVVAHALQNSRQGRLVLGGLKVLEFRNLVLELFQGPVNERIGTAVNFESSLLGPPSLW